MRKAMALACIFCTSTALADPSPTVRYLMNEPLTLFEWGMFRLEARADKFAWDNLDIRKQGARVEYDWSKNQLQIHLTVFPRYQSLQKIPAREVCGSLIHQTKGLLGVSPGSELWHERDGISSFFRHQQFDKPDAPKTMNADLEAITVLEYEIWVSKTDQPPFSKAISCSSELLGTETRYFTTSETR